MSIWSFVGEKLFGAVIEQKVQERLPAASAAADDGGQWRRLSGNSNRVLPIAIWQRQVEICYWLWKTNPLANWMIEVINSFVTGKGFTYTAKNEEVKAIFDDFWNDPVNRMGLKFKNKIRELSLFGLQCWPTFVAEQTGKVRLGMIDPAQIADVFSDPENAEIQIGVKISSLHTAETRYLKIILAGEAEMIISEAAKQMRETYTDGECFFFSINRVSNDPFGTSDIFPLADALDEYETFLFECQKKARKQNAFVWDVEMQDATPEECQKYANENVVKSDGALRVHNQKVKWEAVSPELKAVEIEKVAAVFRNHILGNKSIPEHWYGGGGNVNRATASESNEPFFAFVDDRQDLAKEILETIFTYVIQKALEARYLRVPEAEAFDFAVQKPEVTNKDLTKISTAVRDIVTSMVAAATQGWLDRDTAVDMFAFVVKLIGFEIDPKTILESDPGYADYKKAQNGPSNLPQDKNKQ